MKAFDELNKDQKLTRLLGLVEDDWPLEKQDRNALKAVLAERIAAYKARHRKQLAKKKGY